LFRVYCYGEKQKQTNKENKNVKTEKKK